MKNNKKRNTIITCIIVGIVLLASAIAFFLNNSMTSNGLSVLERKWLTDHENQIIDIMTINDIPVLGYNGNGVNFDFLNFFTEKYNVSFNKISYYAANINDKNNFGFLALTPNEKINKNDILFGEDYYSIIAKNNNQRVAINEISKIGIIKDENNLLKNYFQNKEIIEYETIADLITAINQEDINYVCLPILQYMDKIVKNDLNIVTHVEDLKMKYVLRVPDSTIYEIMRKTFIEYSKKNFKDDYGKNYLQVFFNAKQIEDTERKNYNSKIYHYGYVVNMPFENTSSSNDFIGIISSYLLNYSDISFSEIDIIKYNSIDDLKSALVGGEIDFALANFNYENLNLQYRVTNSIRDLEYIVLSKKSYNINSIKGLANQKVSVVAGTLLSDLCKENEIKTESFSDTNELLRSIDDESIVLLDKETYDYYKNEKLNNYYVLLNGQIEDGYRFILNEENKTFDDLFEYYIDSMSYNNIKYQYHERELLENNYTGIRVIVFMSLLVTFLIITVLLMNRKNTMPSVYKKEERLKYIDPMTSLKNRSYLNKNIYAWDENVIFPQAIVVFDLNHIKRINDKYGREVGDEIIKKTASILINQQLENTDIIRSDGDEFIVYMIGYDENTVKEYMKKLQKLMKEIPKSLGVEAGYSMIYDEVKTIDDAINEAILMEMREKERVKGAIDGKN